MPTPIGWAVAGLGIALIAGGRVLGLIELYVLGALVVGLVVISVVRVRTRPLRLDVTRVLEPQRVPAGAPARVELRLHNTSGRATPVLRLQDEVSGTKGARLLVPPIDPRGDAAAAYRLPTDKRGVVGVGPLRIEIVDPFGLAQARTSAAPRADLIVHPVVHLLQALPQPDGTDPHAGTDVSAPLSVSGDEFHALRPYVSGDDLRRIHWPSSARHDQLLVRQDERPRQGRVTVLLDVRTPQCTEDSLDITASVAASVLHAAQQRRELTRLVTTSGIDTGYGSGAVHADTILRALALVGPGRPGSLLDAIDATLAHAGRSSVVISTSGLTDNDQGALELARRRAGTCTVVAVDPSAWDARAPDPALVPSLTYIAVSRRHPFPEAWEYARRRRGRAITGSSKP
ncbi:MAG: DUF58 domain-containing protein [Acidimicrobiia bacterium]|nr:DUF58 domain-containing protein [Acidimicrobiia bacterium]